MCATDLLLYQQRQVMQKKRKVEKWERKWVKSQLSLFLTQFLLRNSAGWYVTMSSHLRVGAFPPFWNYVHELPLSMAQVRLCKDLIFIITPQTNPIASAKVLLRETSTKISWHVKIGILTGNGN